MKFYYKPHYYHRAIPELITKLATRNLMTITIPLTTTPVTKNLRAFL